MTEESWGPDDFNDREEEAAQWCEKIMVSEGRERLLQQYYGTDEMWLYHRLCEVLDDCVFYNPSNRPMSCLTELFMPVPGYGKDFWVGLGLSDPFFNLGGVILGHMAAFPQHAVVFSSRMNPIDHHGFLKWDKERLPKICDWKIAKNCENRRRYVLAFPLGNRIVYFSTCNPCVKELPNRI